MCESLQTLKMHTARRFISISFFVISIFCSNSAFANDLESKIKAVLTYKILSYIQFPISPSGLEENIFRIGFSGNDDEFAVFKALEGKKIKGKSISVEPVTNTNNLALFNGVFISQNSDLPWEKVLTSLKGTSTLTLGETDSFAETGGMIGFYKFQNKIRFVINKDAAEGSGLKINAQLFRVGKLVGD
jgi:hypothetical protein